jgi:hypothetical protein
MDDSLFSILECCIDVSQQSRHETSDSRTNKLICHTQGFDGCNVNLIFSIGCKHQMLLEKR